jgi:choline-glycine betaine transporter
MNRTQIRIVGWALVFIGVLVLSGVIIKNLSSTTFFAADPFFYVGFVLIVAGAVVLAGGAKGRRSTEQPKKDHQQEALKEIQQEHPHTVSPEALEAFRLLAKYRESKKKREGK